MTKRTAWPMRVEAGTKNVGTARVRDDSRPKMTAAQQAIFAATGNRPQVDSGFDEIADGFDPGAPIPLSMQKPKRPTKYRNTKCEHNGIKFDSAKERSRWFHLNQLQTTGHIRDLELQVAFVLTERMQRDDGTWERASKYVADFVYVDGKTGKQVVEDVKSAATRKNRAYIQKRKAMLEKYGITIKEV
ncbi:hypothetical protein WT15_23795 [Burkholderia stagnalis]|uniref:DUF1064 domain-containing protein n=1 Tax=Burkholderia stagnalis TaxID=1503054 RepID=UPI000756FE47|nr:DUF1064 domain-containing protein [Burkholderia stagnalis]KVN73868.1 hypothetical protein WT15_23795 [Burkholderia stagnalis]KWO27041.1 hypothetical protein WT96_31185 [Burkholderia stagnalis]KWO45038.1 hypothetical protein WT95_26830 [Burkholderia stagnalis]